MPAELPLLLEEERRAVERMMPDLLGLSDGDGETEVGGPESDPDHLVRTEVNTMISGYH
jgi:hypothetical protein